jgi:CHASE2 domain-containing sensor protein
MLQFQPAISPDPRILVVAVNDADIKRFGKPLSDQTILKLLTTLEQYRPKVIGLDIYRDIPLDPGHEDLRNYFQQVNSRLNQPVIAICNYVGSGSINKPQPQGIENGERIGFANTLMEDVDGVVRRYRLSSLSKHKNCQTDRSLGFQMVHQYMQGVSSESHIAPTKIYIPKLQSKFSGYQQIPQKIDDINPIENQVMIYYHPSHIVAEEVSLSKILDHPKSVFLQDRIILIGYVNSETKDKHPTPVGEMFGVRIHAHSIKQLLDASMSVKSFISTWSNWSNVGWIAFWSLLGGIFSWVTNSRRSFILLISVGVLTLLLSSFWAFTKLIWIPVLPPIIAVFSIMVVGRYLPLVGSLVLSKLSEVRK